MATEDKVVTLSSPKLDAVEKLYVRAYLSTLSHAKAHAVAEPGLKDHRNDNKFTRRENVIFHISLGMQVKTEAIDMTPNVILERLYHEATSTGYGTNQAARIQALQILGKHLGLFKEEKAATLPTFNIINYTSQPQMTSPSYPGLSVANEIPDYETETIPNLTISSFSQETVEIEGDIDG